jgi:hypothetical protein
MTVHEKKLGVEFMLPLGEQRKVQDTDLYSLLHIAVVLILLQPVGDLLAEIVEGTDIVCAGCDTDNNDDDDDENDIDTSFRCDEQTGSSKAERYR